MKGIKAKGKEKSGLWHRFTFVLMIVAFVGGLFTYLSLGTPMAGEIVDRARDLIKKVWRFIFST